MSNSTNRKSIWQDEDWKAPFIGGIFLKFDLKRYIPGFLIIAEQKTIKYWGIEYVLWPLFITWILWSGTFFTPPILPD